MEYIYRRTYGEDVVLVVDDLLDDLNHFNSFLGTLLSLHLKRAALRLVQNVGSEQSGKVV